MKIFLNEEKETLYNNAKVRDVIYVCCSRCYNEFSRTKRTVQITLKRSYKLYCSKLCEDKVGLNNLCLNCLIPTKSKFCSKSCSAIFNNKTRVRIKKVQVNCKKVPKPLKMRVCSCGVIDYTRKFFQSPLCKFCANSLMYRESCKFTFNLKDYPDEFDFVLLNEHGMFNPRTNPKGVSRDHIYSVADGKLNKIDGKILAHPANCRLMLQGDNTRKQGKSDITLDELLIKIQNWDIKYGSLVKLA